MYCNIFIFYPSHEEMWNDMRVFLRSSPNKLIGPSEHENTLIHITFRWHQRMSWLNPLSNSSFSHTHTHTHTHLISVHLQDNQRLYKRVCVCVCVCMWAACQLNDPKGWPHSKRPRVCVCVCVWGHWIILVRTATPEAEWMSGIIIYDEHGGLNWMRMLQWALRAHFCVCVCVCVCVGLVSKSLISI